MNAQPRLSAGQMRGQLGHHAIAPLRLPDFAAEGLADLPIQLDQAGVDDLHGAGRLRLPPSQLTHFLACYGQV